MYSRACCCNQSTKTVAAFCNTAVTAYVHMLMDSLLESSENTVRLCFLLEIPLNIDVMTLQSKANQYHNMK